MNIKYGCVGLAMGVCAAFGFKAGAQVLCPTSDFHLDGTDRNFAVSMAVSDQWAAIGASEDSDHGIDAGAVHVFRRDGAGWVEHSKLFGSGPSFEANFGLSVALSGNRIVVGAPYSDASGNNSGLAYVFEYNGSAWVQQAVLLGDGVHANDNFGYVSIEGDRIAIGAPGTRSHEGAVYVFRFKDSAWVQETRLRPDVAGSFGNSVALSTDRLIVGARSDDTVGSDAGAAYVFGFSGSEWVQEAKLFPDEPGTKVFGTAVSLSGDCAAVSSRTPSISGWVYLFQRDAGAWPQETKLTRADEGAIDHFGYALQLSGQRLLVGDYQNDVAYVYGPQNGAWIEQAELWRDDLPDFHAFGQSVCMYGDTLVVGAPGENEDNLKGWAYAFEYVCGPPENDACAGRVELQVPSVTEGTTHGGDIDLLDECAQGAAVIAPSVWYSVVGSGGWLQAETCAGARFNTKISVYEGSCETPVCVTGDNNTCGVLSTVQWEARQDVEYFIVVHGTMNESGPFTLTLTESPGEFDCNRVNRISGECRGDGGEVRNITAKLSSDLPQGTTLHFTLDGVRTESASVNERGKAKADFTDVGPYEHVLGILECPWFSHTTDCGNEGPPDLVWITHDHPRARAVAFSPDGSMVASGGTDNVIKLRRATDGSVIRTFTGHDAVIYGVAFSPDGTMLASGSRDHTVKFWNVVDGSLIRSVTLHGRSNLILRVDFSPDGGLLAAAGADGYLTVLRVSDGALVLDVDESWPVEWVHFSADGQYLAYMSLGLSVRRTSDWSMVLDDTGGDNTVAWSPDGKLLATGGRDGQNGTVHIWKFEDGAVIRTMTGFTDETSAVAFSTDGSVVGAVSLDATVRFWNVADGRLIRMYDEQTGNSTYGFDFSPVEALFSYSTYDGYVAVARNPF